MLASPSVLRAHMENANLTFVQNNQFGQDYARTLNHWHTRFLEKWPEIEPLGFDARFKKLWRFYLSYCEAGFRAGTTNVGHVLAIRD